MFCTLKSEGLFIEFHLISDNFSADIEEIKKVVNCPMKDTTVHIKLWPQNYNTKAVSRRKSCVFWNIVDYYTQRQNKDWKCLLRLDIPVGK